MAASGASEMVADTDQIIVKSTRLNLHLRFVFLEVIVGNLSIADERTHVEAVDWEVHKSE